MPETDVTELVELDAEKVSGVHGPANGTPFLFLKAAEKGEGDLTGDESEAMEDELTKGEGDLSGDEPEAMERELTKACGIKGCEVCLAAFGKAKLKAKQRNALPASDFADPKGRNLPMHDAPHTRNALARLDQTQDLQTPKAKVEARLKRRAKQQGIEVSAEKMSPGVPAFATAEPKEAGHEPSTGQSGRRVEPMAQALKPPVKDPAYVQGGENTRVIPVEEDVDTLPKVDPRRRLDLPVEGQGVVATKPNLADPKVTAKAASFAVSSLVDAMERIAAGRSRAVKGELPWLAELNGDTSAPGSPTWESLDSATLSNVAHLMAHCCAAIDAIQKREAMESVTNPGDFADAMDLSAANDALDSALEIVARLAFREGIEANAVKVGRRLSRKTQATLEAARDHLNDVIGSVTSIDPQASHGAGEEDNSKPDLQEVLDMGSVTKEELADTVAQAAIAAVKEQSKQKAKKSKGAKKAAAKKAAKKAKKQAKKEMGNSGVHANINAAEMKDQVRGRADARDVNAVPDGGDVSGEYENNPNVPEGSMSKAGAEKLAKLEKQLEDTQKQLAKVAKAARRGGPVLDGQFRGAFPASEGRDSEHVTKSATESEIERLEKQLSEEMKGTGPEAAQRASDTSYKLTLVRLREKHEKDFGTANPIAR
jgi:hypothetical protein